MANNDRHTLSVEVQPSYPVHIGEDLGSLVASTISAPRIALISDKAVFDLHGESLLKNFKKERVSVHTFPSGEESKSPQCYAALLSELVQAGLDRKSAIIALGGGVTGDLAGFVAASYMRGIDVYQVPTSLLAMVDASVGGKTGINLPEGKNLVGAFWQPKAVFINVAYLRTLPETVFKEGAVEHFKHGLLADKKILEDVQQADFHAQGNVSFLSQTIARSIKVKASVVAADEKESGVRAHLNLGHTLAHALEAHTHHKLSHGDAVIYGILFAACLAVNRGYEDERKRILMFLRWVAPQALKVEHLNDLLPYMYRDKKTMAGQLRFVLLKEIGRPFVADDVTHSELQAAWTMFKDTLRGTE